MQKSVSEIFQARRDKSLADFRKRLQTVHAAIPGFAKIEEELLRARIKKDDAALSALKKQRQEALLFAGFPADFLEKRYFCDCCKDTGTLPDGAECVCMKRARYQTAAKLSNLDRLCCDTFENWDFSLMPEGDQRESSKKLYSICEDYANALPDGKVKNLLIVGGTGLGKSYALHAVGNRALERGVPVRLTTAPKFFAAEMERIRGGANENAALFNVELLLIDDLGAEPANSAVSADSLFALFDHRTTEGLFTCAASNLTPAEIAQRYGPRITSRLMDAGSSRVLSLSGRDLRLMSRR
ncbi:MAG: ATP-binding protein [Christensenellales bacterium]|jgi:DNA replication protein DnaC